MTIATKAQYMERLFELCNRPGVMNHPGWDEFSKQIKAVLD
jgi:preprotein translocase subunit Sss1